MYFPQTARVAGGVKYLVRREAHRELPPAAASTHRPDVAVVEIGTPQPGPDWLLRSKKRDILWVECKAPDADQPRVWRDVLNEAAERLSHAHPDRNVWLIVASGLEWMVFYWDPNALRAQPLQIKSANGQELWSLDPRINVAPVAGQRHYDVANPTIINTAAANSLDFWTMSPPNAQGEVLPQNLGSCLLFLEQIFQAVQTRVYPEANPTGLN